MTRASPQTARAIGVIPGDHFLESTIAWKTSRTWRRNSGSASRKSTPLWASDTSPDMGTWPPPISPASEMILWEARHGRVVTKAVRSPVRPATLWSRVGLECLGEGHRRQDGGKSLGQHRRARLGRAEQQ